MIFKANPFTAAIASLLRLTDIPNFPIAVEISLEYTVVRFPCRALFEEGFNNVQYYWPSNCTPYLCGEISIGQH